MKAEKDKKTGKWLIQYRYTDWQGKRRKSTKRGFATKREAEEWLRNFLITQKADFDMKFADFWKMYCADMETRLREHTMRTKKYIVELKILLYFGNKRVNDITAADIRQWQNELIKMGYSPTYLKTINNQLSAIFNYVVRYYDLKSNPCAKAGSMGKSKAEEMDFWTGEEFRRFIDSVMNKRLSYMAFMTLYWTGMRLGELLALTLADFNFETHTLRINKSYQRLHREDVITPPKTLKSNRTIKMSQFLCDEMQDYLKMLYEPKEDERIFTISKSYLHHEMNRGAKISGVKRIRVHDLRHSHVSLLINMGFTVLAIADRMEHESIDITYRYAHLFPSEQIQMAEQLDIERMEKSNGEESGQ